MRYLDTAQDREADVGPRPLVVVLGSSGFIGSAVTTELAELPVRLRLVSRGKSAVPEDPVAEVEAYRADLSQPGRAAEAVAGADTVVHLASGIGGRGTWREADERSERFNVDVAREMVGALDRAGVGHRPPAVVFTSTIQAGEEGASVSGSYAAQKLAAERILLAAHAEGRINATVLRLCTVYGRSPLTGSTGLGVLAAMVDRALAGEPLTIWHDGSVERDLLEVSDAAAAVVAAVRHKDRLGGDSWVVATGHRHRLDWLFGTIADLVAERTGRDPVPVVSSAPPENAGTGDFRTPLLDPSGFAAATGWHPKVPLREGMAAVVDALSRQGPDPTPADRV